MDNHYHLLLESVEGRLAALMQHLNGTYGRGFNRRRGRVGHLFQGRFGANLIDREEYFLQVVRYIELNPCRAGLVLDPADWEWSSFRPRLVSEKAPACLSLKSVLGRFGPSVECRSRYRRFVLAGLADDSMQRQLHEETIIGSAKFVSRHSERARKLEDERRVPVHQRIAGRPELAELLRGLAGDNRRSHAIRAFSEYGYTLTEIARQLEVHYTTVGRWVRRAECDNA
jgi:hypothetical protein